VTAVSVLRAATVEDLDAIAAVMRASVLAIFPGFYDERQTASAAVHIAHVDPMLVADGTYFVFVGQRNRPVRRMEPPEPTVYR